MSAPELGAPRPVRRRVVQHGTRYASSMSATADRQPPPLLPPRSAGSLLGALARRIPFTLAIVLAILAVTTATGTISHPISSAQLDRWGFGLADLRAGRFDALLWAPFQVYRPYMVVTVSGSLLLFLGACEYLLGTRRAVLTFWLTHIVGYLGAYLLLWPFATAGYGWAEALTRTPDVGASAAGFGVAGAVLPFLPASGRKVAFPLLVVYLLAFLLFTEHVWNIEHLLAFGAGVATGALIARRRGRSVAGLLAWPRFGGRQRPQIVAFAVGSMGALNILSALLAPRRGALRWLEQELPLDVTDASRLLTLVLGFALIVLAMAVARGKREAWRLTCAALALSAALHLLKGGNLIEAAASAALLALVVYWRDAFVGRSDPPARGQAIAAALWLAALMPLYGIIGFFVLRYQYTAVFTLGGALRETGARLLFSDAGEYAAETRRARWFLDSIPVLGWSGLAYALALLLRDAVAPQPAASDRDHAERLLSQYGASATSYMTLWQGNALFFGPQRRAFIGYRQSAGVAVALGDPVGPASAWADTVQAFSAYCRTQGWTHTLYAATPPLLPTCERLGYRTLKIGEEALIDLPSLAFRGKSWQDVRSAINRAEREGVVFRLYEGGELPVEIRTQIIDLSAAWLAGKATPEMGFTLGTAADIDDPNVCVAVAVGPDGRVHGFLDWLPIYAARGWALDLMRRAPDGFSGVVEFLIGCSLLAFQARGDRLASLAAAPLADLERGASADPLQRALGFVYERGAVGYNFASLFAFKRKFQPRWQGVYLAYPGQMDLPRIAVAVLRAHMPTLGPRALAEIMSDGLSEWRSRQSGATVGDPARAVTHTTP